MVTMPSEANRFEKRRPTFFKANSKVTQATGFDIDKMRATIGFIPKPGDKSHSVEDLEQQEEGTEIANRAFIALPGARTGNSWKGITRTDLRTGKLGDDLVDPDNRKAFNPREGFIQSALYAQSKGLKYVFGTDRNKKGARVLYRINKIGRNKKGDTFVAKTAIYNVKGKREVTPGSEYQDFMLSASETSRRKMQQWFKQAADKKIIDLMKKYPNKIRF